MQHQGHVGAREIGILERQRRVLRSPFMAGIGPNVATDRVVPEKIGCVVASSGRLLVAAGMPRMYE